MLYQEFKIKKGEITHPVTDYHKRKKLKGVAPKNSLYKRKTK
jgi:hypothetical protein